MTRVRMILAFRLLMTALLLLVTQTGYAQQQTESPGTWKRDALLGDWGGAKRWLEERGFNTTLSLTQFYQGLVSGASASDTSFKYGGKAEVLVNLDAARLGLWDGFSLMVHFELNYGKSTLFTGGTFLPGNTALTFPGTNKTKADITNLTLVQRFGNKVLMLGKINMVDVYATAQSFNGGRGIDNFQHIAFVAPPSGIVPPYIFGMIFSARTTPVAYSVAVYDPEWMVNRSGLEHPFREGVTIRGSAVVASKFFGLPGRHNFAAAFSTQKGIDLEDIEIPLPPGAERPLRTKKQRYFFSYAFEQFLFERPEDPNKGWGLFGQVALSDANPNPIAWSVFGGVGGASPIAGRSLDSFGVGAFYWGYSGPLKRALRPEVQMDDEYGLEMFYNLAVAPWFRVTADLQLIQPAFGKSPTAVFLGLRGKIVF